MEKGAPPDKGDPLNNSSNNLAGGGSEPDAEVGVWSRLFKKVKSKDSSKNQQQLQLHPNHIVTLKGDEGIDSSNVSQS